MHVPARIQNAVLLHANAEERTLPNAASFSFFFIFVSYLFLRKSGIWMSFFCTVLDGTFVPKEECIVGMVKVGIFRPPCVLPLPAAVDDLLTENGEVLLPPREDDGLEVVSDNPVAITVILA